MKTAMLNDRIKKNSLSLSRRGTAAVEFAVIAPIFLLLVAGIIEFGQAFRIQHTLSTAARYGARSASIAGGTNAKVTSDVRDQCVRNLKIIATDVTVQITVNDAVNGNLSLALKGDEINIAVSIPFSKAGAGFFSNTFGTSVIRSSCTFEKE